MDTETVRKPKKEETIFKSEGVATLINLDGLLTRLKGSRTVSVWQYIQKANKNKIGYKIRLKGPTGTQWVALSKEVLEVVYQLAKKLEEQNSYYQVIYKVKMGEISNASE